MRAFDHVIGYSSIKRELAQIADVLQNRALYGKLGVSAPKGLLLYGAPGVGKTLMAGSLIAASGRQAFICRKDKPNGDFVLAIKAVFSKAAESAPSIVFLDDMDKFAKGDRQRRDAEEYVTVQSCIDELGGKDVFVLATANELNCLPHSLLRAGRFDRVIEIEAPSGSDAASIIAHYLKGKAVADDMDADYIAKIMDGHSCAELETVINQAGLYAGFERAERITMQHFLKACMQTIFGVQVREADEGSDDQRFSADDDQKARIVYHECGHAVVSEVLCPGSITLIALNDGGGKGGFTSYCRTAGIDPLLWKQSRIIGALGGMAALAQQCGIMDTGARRDLDCAFHMTADLVQDCCICGLSLHANGEDSQALRSRQELAIAAEVEKYYQKAKEILANNRAFFLQLASSLDRRGYLTAAEVCKIKAGCGIVPVCTQGGAAPCAQSSGKIGIFAK